MSHNLNIKDNGEAEMIYVGETPWHKLGKQINPGLSVQEALEQNDLLWEVAGLDVFAADSKNPGQVVPVNGYQAVTRLDTGETLSIMSDSYRPIQHKEKAEFIKALVGENKAVLETAMVLDGGRKFAVLVKLPKDIVIGKDQVKQYILVADSFDGTLAFTAGLCNERVVCQNTLNVGLGEMKKSAFKVRHTVNVADYVEEAQRVLGFAVKQSKKFEEESNRLLKVKFSETEMKNLAENLFPAKVDPETGKEEVSGKAEVSRAKLLELFENGKGHETIRGTAWAALNAVAEFTDHYRTTRKTGGRSSEEARATSVLFGSAQVMKQAASNYIYQQLAA